ncbi:uncharacterized protein LOC129279614 [Lytechinus pictus]|uniref:uncharacterized protein LOC129279614 n=1 Tax=Lytechinus pictus TaxID=7653 RepID=UPI0030B9FD10
MILSTRIKQPFIFWKFIPNYLLTFDRVPFWRTLPQGDNILRKLSILGPTHLNTCRIPRRPTSNSYSVTFTTSQLLASEGEALMDGFPLKSYSAAPWMEKMQNIPKQRIELAMLNTPIHRWHLPGTPTNFEVFIKRDDMTGSSLSGNKIRKLEFLLADAVSQGCDTVITCGGVRSNHCRTTAVASRQLGMDCHLLLRSEATHLDGSFTGNTLLDSMVGCSFYLIPKKAQYNAHINPRMQQLESYLRDSLGKRPYPIPIGGSNAIGVFGYIDCFRELLEQNVQNRFSDIVITTGSSGSLAGLAIGNYLTGSRLRVIGMAVCDDARYFHGEINKVLCELGLQGQGSSEVRSEDIVDVVDGVKGLGYGVSQPEELDCINQVARSTGIFVDPVYTGKATFHLMRLMREEPERFQGSKILFIHTGGVFDLFSGAMSTMADGRTSAEKKVYDWMEMTDKTPLSQS